VHLSGDGEPLAKLGAKLNRFLFWGVLFWCPPPGDRTVGAYVKAERDFRIDYGK